MANNILFALAVDPSWYTTDDRGRLEKIAKHEGVHFDAGDINLSPPEPSIHFNWFPHNLPGEMLARNVQAHGDVMVQPLTVEGLERRLSSGEYSHVVLSGYLNAADTLVQAADHIRQTRPGIKVIGSSVATSLPGIGSHFDHVLKGDYIRDLRNILGESQDTPWNVPVVVADTSFTMGDHTRSGRYALVKTQYGCPNGCDFCPSTAQYGRRFISPHTPEQIKQALMEVHDMIDPKASSVMVSLADPFGLGDVRTWKEVFRLCEDLPYEIKLVTTSSAKIMERYDLPAVTQGPLRLVTVNFGVESTLEGGYQKNEGLDLARGVARMQEHGIVAAATYIIGLDWHTPDNLHIEAANIRALDADCYIGNSPELHPGTPLYNRLQSEGRLLDVPPELLSFRGYLPIRHPAFRSGFKDMPQALGLMEELIGERSMSEGYGLHFYRSQNPRDAPMREVYDNIMQTVPPDKQEQAVFQQVFPGTVELFNPFLEYTN